MSAVESEKVDKAQNKYVRRAPLEEGRDGLVEGHDKFYFSAKPCIRIPSTELT